MVSESSQADYPWSFRNLEGALGELVEPCWTDERSALVHFDELRATAVYQGAVAGIAEPLIPLAIELAGSAPRQAVRLGAIEFLQDLSGALSYAELTESEQTADGDEVFDRPPQ